MLSFWRFGLLVAIAHAQQCVTKQLISAGDGVTFPKAGDTVSMHYTGTLASTGAKFDSSRDRGREFSTQIGVGQVIKGWDQGVPQMSLGERAILRISATCGYGASGSPPTIPPNADLVFDVELNGVNGRRAGSPAAASLASAPAALPSTSFGSVAAAPAVAPASGSLPRCIKSSCGHAISFDTTGASRPLCLCNPLCEQMRNTPGVLPCCPGLQEICLDPYRSPSEQPFRSTAAPTPALLPAFAAATNFAAPAASASFGATALSSNVGSANFGVAVAAGTPFLPTCRPNSCGKGMASGVNSNVAVCACDVSCLSPGSSLPCCTSFREVCQSSLSATTALSAAPLSSLGASSALSASSAPLSQTQFNTQFAARPAASATATDGCALGKTKWAEQPSCDKKRYAIQNGKCKKTCPPLDASVTIQSYPTGQPGKDACATALAQCQY